MTAPGDMNARALKSIGALAGFGPLTKIGVRMDTRPLARVSDSVTSHEAAAPPSDAKRHEEPARPLQSARAGRSPKRVEDARERADGSPARAARIASTISELQKLVLDFIRSRGASGCTDLDIQHRFGNHGSTYRTRRAELTALELVRDSGVRVMQDGGRRIVWIAVDRHGR